jgi:hypothetical protein
MTECIREFQRHRGDVGHAMFRSLRRNSAHHPVRLTVVVPSRPMAGSAAIIETRVALIERDDAQVLV